VLDSVITAAVDVLAAAGLTAGPFYPQTPPGTGVSVMVGAENVRRRDGGFDRYLGLRPVPGQDSREIYGMRCDLTLRLDIYAPLTESNAAMSCLAAFDSAAEALDGAGTFGITGLSCGTPEPAPAAGCFHLKAAAECCVLLLRENSGAGETTFTDFVLRGEPES